jgi:ADP-heptose:LPS heptosyltransferase
VVSTGPLRLIRKRYPNAEITILGEPATVPIFEGAPTHDRVIAFTHYDTSKLTYYRRLLGLRRQRFDLSIDLQGSGGSKIRSAIIGCRTRIGFNRRSRLSNLAYTERVPQDRSKLKLYQLGDLLEPMGIRATAEELRPVLPVTASHRTQAQNLLATAGANGPFALLQVTTRPRADHRVWPMERFARVAEELHRLGLQVVVTSISRDAEALGALASLASCPIVNVSGQTPLLVLAALVADASLYVGYNTGPMHIGAAMGTPIVALYDVPSDLVEWLPVTTGPYRILQAKPAPTPPGWRMDTIEAIEVITAARDILGLESNKEVDRQFGKSPMDTGSYPEEDSFPLRGEIAG